MISINREKKLREEAKKREEEEKRLFRPAVVVEQKVDASADPKSVFCAFFKQGLCKKGAKCKFSHDPAVERKAAKRNIYADSREDKDENMENWDEAQLADVVNKKHGGERANQTDIICKYFLDAVENSKYGWFWSCPNGGDKCMYRHALPPGFVLKKDKKKEEKTDEVSLEELIEERRAELSSKADQLTKVTIETFLMWTKRKLRDKKEAEEKEKDKRKDKYKAGLTVGLSGREMFTFDPKMAGLDNDGDEEGGEAFDLAGMEKDEEEEPVKVHEIKFDEYGIMDDGLDESTADQLAKYRKEHGTEASAVAIDEDLFEDEDLDELEEGMTNLDV